MTSTKAQPRDLSTGFNRAMYGAMIALTVYQLFFTKDISSAMSTLGIGLIFDPFDQKVKWAQRPLHQKVTLLVHVSVVFVLLGITVFNYFTR